MDYPRDEIMRKADAAIAQHGGPSVAKVWFKFTCPACGERCNFNDPNTLWEQGECCRCGHTAPVLQAGFSLELSLQ